MPIIKRVNPFLMNKKAPSDFMTWALRSKGSLPSRDPENMKLMAVVSQSPIQGRPSSGRCRTMEVSGTEIRLMPTIFASTVSKSWECLCKKSNHRKWSNHSHKESRARVAKLQTRGRPCSHLKLLPMNCMGFLQERVDLLGGEIRGLLVLESFKHKICWVNPCWGWLVSTHLFGRISEHRQVVQYLLHNNRFIKHNQQWQHGDCWWAHETPCTAWCHLAFSAIQHATRFCDVLHCLAPPWCWPEFMKNSQVQDIHWIRTNHIAQQKKTFKPTASYLCLFLWWSRHLVCWWSIRLRLLILFRCCNSQGSIDSSYPSS